MQQHRALYFRLKKRKKLLIERGTLWSTKCKFWHTIDWHAKLQLVHSLCLDQLQNRITTNCTEKTVQFFNLHSHILTSLATILDFDVDSQNSKNIDFVEALEELFPIINTRIFSVLLHPFYIYKNTKLYRREKKLREIISETTDKVNDYYLVCVSYNLFNHDDDRMASINFLFIFNTNITWRNCNDNANINVY